MSTTRDQDRFHTGHDDGLEPLTPLDPSRVGTDDPIRRYRYAVRICLEPEHRGGLSGCTYSEGVSWGKFVPESEGGRFAEVHADATIAWPLVVRAVIERLEKEPR
jgi:deoxyhypusine synthase